MSPVLTDAVLDTRASICLRGCDQVVIGGDLASIDPAALEPIGAVSAWRGSGPISGAWWASTLGINVEVGNQRERDAVMLEDFSGDLRLVTTRPMRLTIPAVDGDLRPSHLIQRASGHWDLLLTDPVEPALREAFSRVTGFRLHSPALLDHPVFVPNVRWLAGFRFSRFEVPGNVRDYLTGALASPRSIRAVCAKAPSATGLPRDATLAGLYRMLWDRELVADLTSSPLNERTEVVRA